MPRFAAIKTDNGFFWPEKFRELPEKPPDLPHKGIRFLPVPVVTPPTSNPETELVSGPIYTVEATEVVEGWSKRALTAPEIDAAKDLKLQGLAVAIFEALFFLLNEVRVLKGQAPLNRGQARAAFKALIP